VRVNVVPQVLHPKTRVSGAQSFGRAVGSTRVNRIGALQFGHLGVSAVIDGVMVFPPKTYLFQDWRLDVLPLFRPSRQAPVALGDFKHFASRDGIK
jgi:hypothetical protein